MLAANLITVFTEPLEQHAIPYMITGSVAAIVYGEPRLTHDVDLVLNLTTKDIEPFIACFPLDAFYCPPKETIQIELARENRAHFNLIHTATMFKADCYLMGTDPLHRWGIERRRSVPLDAKHTLWVAPPEYVILRKLEYYREGRSTKHLDDIAKMLPSVAQAMDHPFLHTTIAQLGLQTEWEAVQQRAHPHVV